MKLVFRLVENRAAAEFGYLLLGVVGRKGEIVESTLSSDAFVRVSDAALVGYALPEAVQALGESDPERAKALLRGGAEAWSRIKRRLSPIRRLWLARTSAYLGFEEGVALFAEDLNSKIKPKADMLKRLFAEQKRAARKLGVGADYPSVRKVAHGIDGEKQGEKRPKGGASEPIRIGLLNYRGMWAPSANLGDFIQTIGIVGQLSRFAFDKLTASEAVRDLLAQGRRRDGEAAQSVNGAVELVPVDRDFPVTVAADGPIWLPLCCWFGWPIHPGRFDFPFPGNVRPLFMAFHIADPEFLDEESLAYLRRFEPIGCRDLFTARLLRGAGVKAFFNGCVTMTLDRLRPGLAGGEQNGYSTGARVGRYDTDKTGAFIDKGFTQSRHGDPACLVRDFGGNLRAALALLDRYHTAEEVRTDRVHCWLPCRAMGVPATLKIAGETRGGIDRADPRLDGLADLDDEAFRETALWFEAVAQPVLSAIMEGRGEAEVYALWRKVTAPAMARTDAMIAERNAQYPVPEGSLESLGLGRAGGAQKGGRTEGAQKGNDIPVQTFGAEREPESDEVHLLFAFDANLAEHFPGTFEGVWRHASRPLTAHVFGRGLDAAMFERWAAMFARDARRKGDSRDARRKSDPGVRFTYRDLSDFAFGDVRLLPHTTVSAMDRLLAPELLPDVERVVYLDMDILVRKDIAELFDEETGESGFAACRGFDAFGAKYACLKFVTKKYETFRNAFFSGGATVFEELNSGVLVMNLAALRCERATEKMLALVREFGVHDEMAINLYARERKKSLTRDWNFFPFHGRLEDPSIVHFTGGPKPWSAMCDAFRFHREWRKNAMRARMRSTAPERGLRPPPAPEPAA